MMAGVITERMAAMQHFLLIYDHKEQQLREARPFAEEECTEATDAYQEAEAKYQKNEQIEIVLIGADSLDMIRRTHGHYFDGTDRLAKYLTPTG